MNNCGSLRESVIDDIIVKKFNFVTTQIAMLSEQLRELDELVDEYMEIEKSKVSVEDDILPAINDDEKDLLLSAIDFLNEYKELYGYIPNVESVFTPAEKDEINKRLEEYEQEEMDISI